MKLNANSNVRLQNFNCVQAVMLVKTFVKHSAIRLIKEGEEDTEYKYLIDETKCIHCFECINHYTGGCYMRRVLLPRGKGYTDDK